MLEHIPLLFARIMTGIGILIITSVGYAGFYFLIKTIAKYIESKGERIEKLVSNILIGILVLAMIAAIVGISYELGKMIV